jgi:MFS transporter, FSR family, fosmidomycin resistance protein
MISVRLKARPALAGLLTALAVEFVDELFDGTKSAAMPLIRHDLALSYVQVGLLSAVPLFAGSLIELPVGVISGTGARRRRVVLGGGVLFIAAVLGAGLAPSFSVLLAALVIFFPASGAFVSLTEAALLDANPQRRAQLMARWTLAGSLGALAGPLLAAGVLAVGGSWRTAFAVCAAAAATSWLAMAAEGPGRVSRPGTPGAGQDARDAGEAEPQTDGWPGIRAAGRITLRSGAIRWLVLLQVADLLLDVFSAFLALYLVVVAHASPAVAALGVGVRLGAGLAGDVLLVGLLERQDPLRVLRASVLMAGLLFPAFLLVPGLGVKLVILALLSVATAPWYPVLQAELFRSLPGHSGLAVSLTSAAGMAGGLGPLLVGLLAQHLGLSWAMAALALVPVVMLAAPVHPRRPEGRTGLG